MYEKSNDPIPEAAPPLSPNEVDCTVQLYTVKDGDGFRSAVRFFMWQDPTRPTREHPLPGEANGSVVLGWSDPLGETLFPTRDAVRAAYETTKKGVPATVWVEDAAVFEAREPHAEALPAGVGLDRTFAKALGLATYVPQPGNPHVYEEAPIN